MDIRTFFVKKRKRDDVEEAVKSDVESTLSITQVTALTGNGMIEEGTCEADNSTNCITSEVKTFISQH
jgi:predicted Mrr-cat superfamily restriction endonuclease